jgi:hypothetical protein
MDDKEQQVEKHVRSLIDVKEEWPWYWRMSATIINFIPTLIWFLVAYFLLTFFAQNSDLVIKRNLTLNISVPIVAWGILSLIATLTLVSTFFPYFSYKRIMLNGDPRVQSACLHFWGMLSLAAAIIIAAGVR